jgi:hypothetical protein
MRRFFHQRVAERGDALQERLALLRLECRESLLERTAAVREPVRDRGLRRGGECDDRSPPVCRIFAPLDEVVLLELACELARGRQRKSELLCEVADASLALRADLREDCDVAPTKPRPAADECEQVGRGAAARPEAAHHTAQCDS